MALTADGKRKTTNGMPLPLASHALIKIEDVNSPDGSHQNIFEPEKSLSTSLSMSGADISSQLFYQPASNLIQIAPQSTTQTPQLVESSTECRSQALSPHPCTPPPSDSMIEMENEQTHVPEVQDANIQTSPVMSEDDNSNATTDEQCTGDSQDADNAPTSTFEPMCHESEIHSSTLCTEDRPSSMSMSINNHLDEAIDSVVSSSEIVPTIRPKVEMMSPEKNQCVIFPSRFTTSLNESISTSTTATGCDVSGLELLSRSIEVFHKKTTAMTATTTTSIKQEPLSPQPESSCLSPIQRMVPVQIPVTVPEPQQEEQPEQLGGLNLLCALAEQRFQEEVGSIKKSNSSTSSSEEFETRKRKHKHSGSKKSSKRPKHDHDKPREKKHKRHITEEEAIKHSLHRVKSKYSKCACPDRRDDGHRCHQSNWPTTAEIISVMESEVKERLVNMMRKCEEKKRELAEIHPIVKSVKDKKQNLSDRESSATPPSIDKLIVKPSSFSSTSSLKFSSSLSALSPNFSTSSNSESTGDHQKASSDTDSSKSEELETSSSERSSKRKGGTPKRHDDSPNTETIVAKKPKSLIGYILASKDRVSDHNVKGMVYANSVEEMRLKNQKLYPSPSLELFTTDSSSDSSYKKKAPFKFEQDEDSKPAFSIFGGDKQVDRKLHKEKRHKKKKSSKRQEREKRKIDQRCILKPAQLEQSNLRVLTCMGGLFYAGRLSAIQSPDIYAVTLDGERGNRPHIMSREEVLRDAVSWLFYSKGEGSQGGDKTLTPKEETRL